MLTIQISLQPRVHTLLLTSTNKVNVGTVIVVYLILHGGTHGRTQHNLADNQLTTYEIGLE
jgi:hypothetical protein